jgi:hypothetical protein
MDRIGGSEVLQDQSSAMVPVVRLRAVSGKNFAAKISLDY